MDLKILRCSGGGFGYMKSGYYPVAAVAVLGRRSAGNRAMRWRALWRRLKKIRMFGCGGRPRESHVPYNPETYLQNFDEGSVMVIGDDPDTVSRSFSARFAILHRPAEFVLQKNVKV